MSRIQPGDVIAFSGNDWVSDAINVVTFGLPRVSIHHVGIISFLHNEPLIYEAIGCEGGRSACIRQGRITAGFQAHRLDDVLETVGGKVFHLPLRRELYRHEQDRLAYFLDARIGLPYDKLGAARSGGFMFRALQAVVRREDLTALFCSEVAAAALVDVGVFKTRSAGKWNPNALCRALRRRGICGPYRKLK